MSSVYERGISIISKPIEKRDETEINSVLIWFVNLFKRKVAVFGDISKEIVSDIIKNCSFESRKTDEVIIRQGDVGDCFYVVLRGKVSIYINHKQHDDNDDYEEETNSSFEQNLEISTDTSDDSILTTESMPNKRIRDTLGNFVTSLKTGEGFGEYALVSDDLRSASIIADEWTDLMVVNKALYSRCLQAPTLRRMSEKQDFINKSPFFGNWSKKMKKLLTLCLERDIIMPDSYLGKQGEPADRIFFIIKGQAKIIIDPTVHAYQYPTFFPIKTTGMDKRYSVYNDDNILCREPSSLKIYGDIEKTYKDNMIIRRRMFTFAEAEKRRKIKQNEVGIIGPGEITGIFEIILGMETYMQSIKCLESCDVFYIYKQNYERLVKRRNPKSIKQMQDYVYLKLEARNSRIENTNPIQLFEILRKKLQESIFATENKILSTRKHQLSTSASRSSNNNNRLPPTGPIVQVDTKPRSKAKTSKTDDNKNKMSYNIYANADLNSFSLKKSESDEPIVENNQKRLDDSDIKSTDNGIDLIDDKSLHDLEDRIRQWHFENGCKNPLLEQLHRVNLEKIKTGIKSGGKIILKSAKSIQSAKPTSSQQTDGNSSERSTESEDDFDYFGGIFEGLKSGTTNRRTSSNLSHRTSTLLFNSLANDNSLRYLFYQQISNSAFKPDNPNQCKRLSLQYELHNRIRKTSRQSLHSCDTHKPDKRLSLPTKLSQNLVQDAAHHTESMRKSSAFSTSSYIDNIYSVPMQCSPYLFRKLSMSQLKNLKKPVEVEFRINTSKHQCIKLDLVSRPEKVRQFEKTYTKKEYLLLKTEMVKQTRRLSVSR